MMTFIDWLDHIFTHRWGTKQYVGPWHWIARCQHCDRTKAGD